MLNFKIVPEGDAGIHLITYSAGCFTEIKSKFFVASLLKFFLDYAGLGNVKSSGNGLLTICGP